VLGTDRVRYCASQCDPHPLQGRPQAITLSPPTNGSSSGCANASKDLVQTILQNPDNFYIVVHNTEFPNAALDGLLSPSK
jgi:hypothetical protein